MFPRVQCVCVSCEWKCKRFWGNVEGILSGVWRAGEGWAEETRQRGFPPDPRKKIFPGFRVGLVQVVRVLAVS